MYTAVVAAEHKSRVAHWWLACLPWSSDLLVAFAVVGPCSGRLSGHPLVEAARFADGRLSPCTRTTSRLPR